MPHADPAVRRAYQRKKQAEYRAANPERYRAAGRRANRRKYETIWAYKLSKGCVDCGYKEHPAALQFDHRDPTAKTVAISRIINCSWAKQAIEIAKCDVRCANCHAIRTFNNAQRNHQ